MDNDKILVINKIPNFTKVEISVPTELDIREKIALIHYIRDLSILSDKLQFEVRNSDFNVTKMLSLILRNEQKKNVLNFKNYKIAFKNDQSLDFMQANLYAFENKSEKNLDLVEKLFENGDNVLMQYLQYEQNKLFESDSEDDSDGTGSLVGSESFDDLAKILGLERNFNFI